MAPSSVKVAAIDGLVSLWEDGLGVTSSVFRLGLGRRPFLSLGCMAATVLILVAGANVLKGQARGLSRGPTRSGRRRAPSKAGLASDCLLAISRGREKATDLDWLTSLLWPGSAI